MNADAPLAYPFVDEGGRDSLYSFTTDNGIAYEVKFVPSAYALGDDFLFADEIFELVLKVVESPGDKRPPFDARTAPTVAVIVRDFYDRSSLTITIYICDTSDRREKARWYKFNRWYDYFSASNYYRADRAVLDEKDGVLYNCAIIIKASNPNRLAVFTAFDRMLDGYNLPK